MMHVYGEYFYGNKISDYGIQHGYVDYATLAKAFDCVLNNTLPNVPEFWDYTEQLSGMDEETEEYPEIFQYYIVSESGAEILEDINEIVYYNSELDIYLWGVTHYGTAWDHVLTNIRCNTGEF